MTYKKYLILGASLLIYPASFDALASNVSRCASMCNASSCKAKPALAKNCAVWCSGLNQYRDRLTACSQSVPGSGVGVASGTVSNQAQREELNKKDQEIDRLKTLLAQSAASQGTAPSKATSPAATSNAKAGTIGVASPHGTNSIMPNQTHHEDLTKKEEEIRKLNALIEQLRRQLTQNTGTVQDESMKRELATFKAKYAKGKIPVKEALNFLHDIDGADDKISAEDLLLFLEQELNTQDAARQESIYEILDRMETISIFKDVKADRENQSNLALINQFKEEGSQSYSAEKTTIMQKATKAIQMLVQDKNNTEILNLVPSALLLLIDPENISKIDQTRLTTLTSYLETATLSQRKALFSSLLNAQVIRSPLITLTKQTTFVQKLFFNLFESIRDGKTRNFSPPTDQGTRVKLESLNIYLLKLGALGSSIPESNASTTTGSQTTTTPSGKGSGMAPPPPPPPAMTPPPPPSRMAPPPPPPPGSSTKAGSPPPTGKAGATQPKGTEAASLTVKKGVGNRMLVPYKGQMIPVDAGATILDKAGHPTALQAGDTVDFPDASIRDRGMLGKVVEGTVKVTNR